jgi:hypothetical protein
MAVPKIPGAQQPWKCNFNDFIGHYKKDLKPSLDFFLKGRKLI